MPRLSRSTCCVMVAALVWLCAFASGAAQAAQTQHKSEAHHHPEAAKLKNPIAATPESLAEGKKLFERLCAECHGDEGKGDGMAGEDMTPPPANLTDADWEHGSTDGEIYVVIRDGTRQGMQRFGNKLTAQQLWHLVNYVRSLGPKDRS